MKHQGIDIISSLPDGYENWRKKIEHLIENSKLNAALHVNTDMLQLYFKIGTDIIAKQRQFGWGKQVIEQLSADLTRRFPDDKGYSVRNLQYMKRFAEEYPQFPILQVPLAEFKKLPISQAALAQLEKDGEMVSVPLAIVSWYHHIMLIPKIKNMAERAFYILEASKQGWSTNVTLMKHQQGFRPTILCSARASMPRPRSESPLHTHLGVRPMN